MSPTPVQENLVNSNNAYAASFTEGHLTLPPAKKYAVGSSGLPRPLPRRTSRFPAPLVLPLSADTQQ
jgi:hypothetical protein